MSNRSLPALADDLFQTLNWPSPDDEAWRRTDLSRLLPKGALDTALAGIDDVEPGGAQRGTPLCPDHYAARIITEGGRPVAMALSDTASRSGLTVRWVHPDELSAGLENAAREDLGNAPDRIAAWHWRDMPGSLVVSLPPQARLEAPVVIEERLIVGSQGSRLFEAPHLQVEAGSGAVLSVFWSFEGSPAVGEAVTPVINAGLTVQSGENARTNVGIRQRLDDRVVFFMNSRLVVQRDGRAHFFESHLGGGVIKTQARALLADEGADARLQGVYVAKAGRHVDIGIRQEHQSPRATSDALYKGAVRPGGRSIFQGLIQVAPKAVKTDAYLTNKNLILGDGARADSLPQLNILTDDVKCSHGSTTGKLDESQLFYLRSRGYSPVEAVSELTRGFLAEVVHRAPAALVEILTQDLDAALSED